MCEDSSQIVNPLTSHVGGNCRPHASANAAVTPTAQGRLVQHLGQEGMTERSGRGAIP